MVASPLDAAWWTVPLLLLAAVRAGLTEEVIFIAYLFDRLRRLGWSWWAIILSTAALRGAYHAYQGVGAIVGNFVMGVVFGWCYRRWGRVMPLVIAHTLLDIVAFVGYPLAAALWPGVFAPAPRPPEPRLRPRRRPRSPGIRRCSVFPRDCIRHRETEGQRTSVSWRQLQSRGSLAVSGAATSSTGCRATGVIPPTRATVGTRVSRGLTLATCDMTLTSTRPPTLLRRVRSRCCELAPNLARRARYSSHAASWWSVQYGVVRTGHALVATSRRGSATSPACTPWR